MVSAHPAPQPVSSLPPLHILVVDDTPDLARSLAEYLSLASTRPVTTEIAFNGAQALMLAAEKPPDIVVMDIRMPFMNGFEAARAIRTSLFDGLPMMIGVAGDPLDMSDASLNRPLAFDHFLLKPVDLQELMLLVGSRDGRRQKNEFD